MNITCHNNHLEYTIKISIAREDINELQKKYIAEIILPEEKKIKTKKLTEEEKKLITFLKLIIMGKTADLILLKKIRSATEFKQLLNETNNVLQLLGLVNLEGELIPDYTNEESVEITEFSESFEAGVIKRHHKNLPHEQLKIAKCCATCQFFVPYSAHRHNHGFCSYKKIPGIRLIYKNIDTVLSSTVCNTRILNPTKQHEVVSKYYPIVHNLMVCDNYAKTVKKTRLRYILEMFKFYEMEVIFEGENLNE